jgi:hypothetical protein
VTNKERARHLANNYGPDERLRLESAILEALDRASSQAYKSGYIKGLEDCDCEDVVEKREAMLFEVSKKQGW